MPLWTWLVPVLALATFVMALVVGVGPWQYSYNIEIYAGLNKQ